ncbi:MAG: hypothetical protein ACOC22_04115 [bacterium]
MLDLNHVNSLEEIPTLNRKGVSEPGELQDKKELIEKQYIELENLGVDLLENIKDVDVKFEILSQVMDFVNENYSTIMYLDQTNISRSKMIEIGEMVYRFICVDCFITLIPNFLSSVDVYDIKQFDVYFKNNLKNDVSSLKAKFAESIIKIINKLMNLSKIDKSVKNNHVYNKILKRYGFYLELVNYGNFENFLFNYFRPVLIKYQAELSWRMM